MNRRHFFRQTAGLVVLPLTGFALGGCGSPKPAELAWGEASCEYCRQSITDKRFAAQIRDGDGASHFFDDVGCAVRWIRAKTLPEHTLGFWVMDFRGGYWVDAFKAHYHDGETSPKGYNLAASAIPGNGGRDFAEAKAYALARPE